MKVGLKARRHLANWRSKPETVHFFGPNGRHSRHFGTARIRRDSDTFERFGLKWHIPSDASKKWAVFYFYCNLKRKKKVFQLPMARTPKGPSK